MVCISHKKGGDAIVSAALRASERRYVNMPIYTDKRTGKKVIQYQIGCKFVPDKKNPGNLIKRPKYRTEVAGKSARLAKKLLAKREAEWEKKKYQDEAGEGTQFQDYTFPELVSWYLQLPIAKKKRSYNKDVERSENLLNYFGDVKADSIKPSMVESFQYQMLRTRSKQGRAYKPATVNRMAALMKRIYNLAIREEMVLKNPCWKVAMLSEDNKRDRILSVDEFDRLIQKLPEHILSVVCVGYYTGMRLGEILGLTWKRVNMKEGFLDLEPENTKTSEPRRFYFDDVLWAIFQKANKVRQIEHNFVFTYHGRPIRNIRKGFTNACQRAGIEDFHFHDLRHTFNTNMRKAGVDQTVIMKLTGHKTLAMFNRYNTIDQEDAVSAIGKLNEFLEMQKSSKVQTMFRRTPEKQKKG
jgi:integrase